MLHCLINKHQNNYITKHFKTYGLARGRILLFSNISRPATENMQPPMPYIPGALFL